MDYDVVLYSIYVDGTAQEKFPKKDSGVKFNTISCSNGIPATFDEDSWSITMGEMTDTSSCKIYFSRESTINPATGTFINILLILMFALVSVYVIRRIIKKNKFYRV